MSNEAVATISCEELRDKIDGGEDFVLVDVLDEPFYRHSHLPGAINIPPDQVDRLAPTLLPDINAPIVVYCSGTCENSEITARRLDELGYQSVRVYLGGKEDWVEHGLPVERTADD